MNTHSAFRRGMSAMVVLILLAGFAFSQNLVINNNSTFTGSGTINVRGNINTPTLTQDKSISGTVNMAKTNGNQSIGTVGTNQTLTFANLNVNTTNAGPATTIQEMATVVVSDALSVAATTTLDIQGKALTISGTSTLNATGVLDVSDVASVVNYNRGDGTAQTVLGLAYAGTLNLSGATSAKSFTAAGSAATMTHAGGSLTVNFDWSVGTSGTFATITDISATRTLSFDAGSTGSSIATLTAVSGALTNNSTGGLLAVTTLSGNTGNINSVGAGDISITSAANGTGTITASGGDVSIATLASNAGTIRTTGAGLLTFSGAAANSGSILGTLASSGAIAFQSTLAQTGGSVTAGPGNVSFTGIVTNDATSNVSAGAGGYVASLDFNGNVGNSGTITLGSQGSATFAGSFTTVGTLTLDAASNWTYDGAAQNIAGGATVTYGNLFTEGSLTKTALGDITVAGNFDNGGTGNLGITTDMDEFTLAVTGSRENTNGTLRFGGLTNGLSFGTTAASAGTVIYDGDAPTVASQTIAAGSYFNLQFENDAPKNMVTNTTVSVGAAGVSLAANVTLNVPQTAGTTTLNIGTSGSGVGPLTLLQNSTMVNDGAVNIAGDLSNDGALTNNGSITVGY